MQENLRQLQIILKDFVRISKELDCPNCKTTTKFIGETRANGGWFCPFCGAYYTYKDNSDSIIVETPFIKLTNQLEQPLPQQTKSILMAVAPVDFPMDLTTGFLVPSYSSGYEIERKTNRLLGQAIDFTRFGRIKSGTIWQFTLGYEDRQVSEYETLISFSETQGAHLPFNYIDPFRGSEHVCYFESDVSPAQPVSFDGVSFSVKISE